ncbi:glycosyl hydrolase family 95 catalytic domain-containing protein [Naumannella huperziae]
MSRPHDPTRRRLLQAGGAFVLVSAAAPALRVLPAHAAPSPTGPLAAGKLPAVPEGALWYARPGLDWQSEALPIGNARLGAMLFGDPANERMQFNEQSLWGGLNNYDNALAGQPDSAFDLSVRGFGCYRDFGEFTARFGAESGAARLFVRTPGVISSGHADPLRALTGGTKTLWRPARAPEVIWQVDLQATATVRRYSLTPGTVRGRSRFDPVGWRLEGSADGYAWTVLDERAGALADRGEAVEFTVAQPRAYRSYRFVFTTEPRSQRLELAGIGLTGDGIDSATAVVFGDYRRSLDPRAAVQTTAFRTSKATVIRECFASRPADVLVLRYRTDTAGALDAVFALSSAQGAETAADADARALGFAGEMANELKFACRIQITDTDGTVSADRDRLRLAGATTVTLLLDARTNYRMSAADDWRGEDPLPRIDAALTDLAGRTFDELWAEHAEEATERAERVAVDWGSTADEVLAQPTDVRLARYDDGEDDPALEQQLFGYGRYLLGSSSQPGGLPANLQGLWNNSNEPPWASDYHTNINLQMNYWGAETTALADSHVALVEYIRQVAVPSRVATRNAFGEVRGWTARTSQSIFGGNSWEWNTVASAWYAQHLWEHYAFGRDEAYLRDLAYPLLKEVCEFWEDRLITKDDGLLYAPDGWSPEHGPREDGVMYDQQIIWDLFQNYREASEVLGLDPDYRARVAKLQEKLAPNKIGRWGQLQEWQTDRDDPADVHRHTSHLFAVYPGRQITPDTTPELAAAALVSLDARCGVREGQPFTEDSVTGDSRRSWTWPWRVALFARLRQAEKARTMIRGLLRFNTLSNFFCTHPPFQIDGNLGITGAIPEMLLQSHTGVIELLPALPKAWADGSFRGLRARGGHRVDCTWRGGRVTDFTVTADRAADASPVTVRVNGAERQVTPRR